MKEEGKLIMQQEERSVGDKYFVKFYERKTISQTDERKRLRVAILRQLRYLKQNEGS